MGPYSNKPMQSWERELLMTDDERRRRDQITLGRKRRAATIAVLDLYRASDSLSAAQAASMLDHINSA